MAERLNESQKAQFLTLYKRHSFTNELIKLLVVFSFVQRSYKVKLSLWLKCYQLLDFSWHLYSFLKYLLLAFVKYSPHGAPFKFVECLLVGRFSFKSAEGVVITLYLFVAIGQLAWMVYFYQFSRGYGKMDTLKFLSGEYYHCQLDEDLRNDETEEERRERNRYRFFDVGDRPKSSSPESPENFSSTNTKSKQLRRRNVSTIKNHQRRIKSEKKETNNKKIKTKKDHQSTTINADEMPPSATRSFSYWLAMCRVIDLVSKLYLLCCPQVFVGTILLLMFTHGRPDFINVRIRDAKCLASGQPYLSASLYELISSNWYTIRLVADYTEILLLIHFSLWAFIYTATHGAILAMDIIFLSRELKRRLRALISLQSRLSLTSSILANFSSPPASLSALISSHRDPPQYSLSALTKPTMTTTTIMTSASTSSRCFECCPCCCTSLEDSTGAIETICTKNNNFYLQQKQKQQQHQQASWPPPRPGPLATGFIPYSNWSVPWRGDELSERGSSYPLVVYQPKQYPRYSARHQFTTSCLAPTRVGQRWPCSDLATLQSRSSLPVVDLRSQYWFAYGGGSSLVKSSPNCGVGSSDMEEASLTVMANKDARGPITNKQMPEPNKATKQEECHQPNRSSLVVGLVTKMIDTLKTSININNHEDNENESKNDNKTTSLFELIERLFWALLGCPTPKPPLAYQQEMVDPYKETLRLQDQLNDYCQCIMDADRFVSVLNFTILAVTFYVQICFILVVPGVGFNSYEGYLLVVLMLITLMLTMAGIYISAWLNGKIVELYPLLTSCVARTNDNYAKERWIHILNYLSPSTKCNFTCLGLFNITLNSYMQVITYIVSTSFIMLDMQYG